MQADVFHLQVPCPMLIFRSKAQLEQYEEHCSHFKQVPVTEWVKQCWATHCNHGLGFGNASKTSLDHNSDLSDFFWWNIYIHVYITTCYKVPPPKKSISRFYQKSIILSPSYEAQEDRMRESLANHMRDSWRRCELQPALDQAENGTNTKSTLPWVYARLLCNRYCLYKRFWCCNLKDVKHKSEILRNKNIINIFIDILY